jgi:hypothetical protein
MTSPYLEQPLVSLGVTLPLMLENIEVELANQRLEAAETERLCHRANVIRWLFAPQHLPENAINHSRASERHLPNYLNAECFRICWL